MDYLLTVQCSDNGLGNTSIKYDIGEDNLGVGTEGLEPIEYLFWRQRAMLSPFFQL
jgi:hypothetical protein